MGLSIQSAVSTALTSPCATVATGSAGLSGRRGGHHVRLPSQRDRLVAAMGELLVEAGAGDIGVHHLCERASVSRRTFYELYVDRNACFLDALQMAHDRLVASIEDAADEAGTVWEDRAVAAVHALIGAVRADRVLAELCVGSGVVGESRATRSTRHGAMGRIVAALADPPGGALPSVLTLCGALGGVWALVGQSLADGGDEAEVAAAAAVYLMLVPFVGSERAAARAADPGRGGDGDVDAIADAAVASPDALLTELAGQTLMYLATHADVTNVEIARAIDVRHESQMSRHLGRLERAGWVCRRKNGRTNAWQLTDSGRETVRSLLDSGSGATRPRDGDMSNQEGEIS